VASEKTLNELFSRSWTRRRYEVWFVRLGLHDGSGAWWFRYLLFNPGLPAAARVPQRMPVQVWATWFPSDAPPETVIQGFSLADLRLSGCRQSPFHFSICNNEIGENSCRGDLAMDGHTVSWNLNYRSTFRATLSDKGWIGFSRTPHSDAIFSGHITLDGRTVAGDPLGFGLQGHNCGYKHRAFWVWTHAYFPNPNGSAATLEALVYDMPLGLVFRKAILWHAGTTRTFGSLHEFKRNFDHFCWHFRALGRDGSSLEFCADGLPVSTHRIPYEKTDGSGTFEVVNNSLAQARLSLRRNDHFEELQTPVGAVLEMGGDVRPIAG
jgi:hypothetical protein